MDRTHATELAKSCVRSWRTRPSRGEAADSGRGEEKGSVKKLQRFDNRADTRLSRATCHVWILVPENKDESIIAGWANV